jgi:hypothetical protein
MKFPSFSTEVHEAIAGRPDYFRHATLGLSVQRVEDEQVPGAFAEVGVYRGETRIQLEHVNRVGPNSAPDWKRGTQDDVYRVEIEGTPSITQETAFRFTDGSGRDAAAAGCLATGLRALNAVPAVNDLPPGWVTALDLALIPGFGTIR